MNKILKNAIVALAFATGIAMAGETYGQVTIDTVKTTISHGGVSKDTTLLRATIEGNSDEPISIPEDITVSQIVIRRQFKANKPQTMVLPFNLPQEAWRAQPLKFWRYAGMLRDRDKGTWQFWTVGYSSDIDANTPFVVIADYDADSIMFNMDWLKGEQYGNVTLNTTNGGNMEVTYQDWKFRGTYERIDWEKGHADLGCVYGFAAKNKDGVQVGQFVKAAPSDTSHPYIRPGRAYLHYSPAIVATKDNGETSEIIAKEDLPETIDIIFSETDEIDSGEVAAIGRINTITGEITIDKWVDLKGRKFEQKPTAKGTYYKNGRRVTIK